MDNMENRIESKLLLKPGTYTSTQTSSACNISGYEGAAFAIVYGTSGDTLSPSLYWTAKLQHCATEAGTYTDIATSDVQIGMTNSFGLISAPSEDEEVYWLGYNGAFDYVKVVVTATGSHIYGTPFCALAYLGMPCSRSTGGKVNP